MGRRPGLVVFYDLDPLPPGILVSLWKLGTAVDRTPHSYGIRNWTEMATKLEALKKKGVRVTEIHVWSHGYVGGPVLGQIVTSTGRKLIRYRLRARHLQAIHKAAPVSYTHLTLPTTRQRCRSRWSPYH